MVFAAACIDKSRALQALEESNRFIVESQWTDTDIVLQVGMETWDGMPGDVPVPEVPKHLFKAHGSRIGSGMLYIQEIL